ncbi:MAG: phospholipase effector Tle1 domain-containing protein [Polaromonas sp.]
MRQALALDEYRRSFEPRPYYIDPKHNYAATGQSIDQRWFSGAHCDVGGGYGALEAHLSNEALLWMLQEAVACQLRLRAGLLDAQGRVDTPAVLAALTVARPEAAPLRARAHSETYTTALWALAGLQQRNPHMVLDGGKPQAVVPVEHPSVAALSLAFPSGTVWAQQRPVKGLVMATLLAAVFWLLAGGLLHGSIAPARMSLGQDFAEVAAANMALARWQIEWAFSLAYPLATLPQPASRVASAVLADFGLIAAYACLLARAVTWAFARVARVRRAVQKPSRWLNLLGLGATVAVLSDVAENLLTLVLVGVFPWPLFVGAEPLVGLAMTVAALAKCAGLLGCGVLFLWGCSASRRLDAGDARKAIA